MCAPESDEGRCAKNKFYFKLIPGTRSCAKSTISNTLPMYTHDDNSECPLDEICPHHT